MDVNKEHKDLIEQLIRSNSRFSGNEDLIEDFCSETLKRSFNILSTVNNIQHIERYINKVASSAILEVLKTSGRLRRTSKGYIKSQEKTLSPYEAYITDSQGFLLFDIPDNSVPFEEEIASKDFVNNVIQEVYKIEKEEPASHFLDLFTLRYIKNLKQKEISETLGLSQGEVSKRLVELSEKINKSMGL